MKIQRLVTAVLPFALMCSLTGCGTTEIDIKNYLTTNVEGYSGYGNAGCRVDLENLIKDNREAFGLVENYSVMDYQWLAKDLSEAMVLNYDKSEELSNGDTITLTFDSSSLKELEDEYNVKFIMQDIDITVSDLEEIVELNPFDKVKIKYSGTEPKARISLDRTELLELNLPTNIEFEISPEADLSNGDTVKIEISESSYDLLLRNGYRLTETEKEYTVDGIDAYLMSLDNLPDDASQKMEQHGADLLNAEIASYWDNPAGLDSINMLGHYLLTVKEGAFSFYHNLLVCVYEIRTTDGFSYYSYVQYPDIMILGDGTCSFDLTRYEKPVGSFNYWGASGVTFEHDGLSYIGYADLDTLFNDAVTQYIDVYEYQSTVS